MIDFKERIIPGCSIGNIRLESNIESYLNDLYLNYKVGCNKVELPSREMIIHYTLDDIVTISTDEEGKIFSVSCNSGYSGKANNFLYAGMTFHELKKKTFLQRIFNGYLIINREFGLAFELPQPYDEIADDINDIPDCLHLDVLSVSDFSSWKRKGDK